MTRYEHGRGKAAKFWHPRVDGKRFYLHFGKVGRAGQTRLKDFASAAAAKAAMAEAIAGKLDDGYREVGPVAKPEKAKPAVPAAKRTALLAIASELGSKKIAAEVAMAIDTPDAYVEKYVAQYEVLEDLEIADVPWIGMIEALNDARRLAEVDWKEAGSEICAWLEALGGAAGKRALKPARAEGEELDERPTHEALERFGQLLGTVKLGLIALDKGSDSYALCVVPIARVAPLQKLARSAGQKIDQFSGNHLAGLEAQRAKAIAKDAKPKNPWKELVARQAHQATDGAVDSVLWDLQHTTKIAQIRDALPFVPARDRPIVELTLALYDGVPEKLARSTRDPELMLRALRYINPNDPEGRYQRLAATAILAARLNIALDGKKRHTQILEACNVWNEGKQTDVVVARLPAVSRELLVRAGNAMLERSRGEGSDGWAAALRMLLTLGDATSLPILEAKFEKERRVRRDNEWSNDEKDWNEVLAAIKRRGVRARRG